MSTEEMIVRGIVQGVGFRPFVWRLAMRLGIEGEVGNRGDAVVITASGGQAALDALAVALTAEAPPLARVDGIERKAAPPFAGRGFTIAASTPGTVSVGVVADIATCPACHAEMRDATARRHRYAFTNCTDCGPRFSIVEGLPYDRATTTMRGFPMCPACRAEYENPADRRFHAQPIACPACGPRLLPEVDGDPVEVAAMRLREGAILAIKGIGGFHIACDATNEVAVAELRARKHRPTKPLAVMVRDRAMLDALCEAGEAEHAALAHPSAPIVLLRMHADAALAPSVAPGQNRLGAMLPYAPLHHLLMEAVGRPLVMTSGNRSSEPQIFRDAEAYAGLDGIVDAFLAHDRPIARRLDDSVVQVAAGHVQVMRRGRGLAPVPRDLPAGFSQAPPVLALGGELKSAICLTVGGKALLSHHLGDLEEPSTQDEFERTIADYTALFAHRAAAIAVDLHPDYQPSRFGAALAAERDLPLIAVQHHHAHIAAVMAERGWPLDGGKVVGIALDGLGLGEDSTIWGAEVLLCDYRASRRLAHLKPIPLAGGDMANREPWRVLLAHLDVALGPEAVPSDLFDELPIATLRAMVARGINAPPASSAGRLFDAMAALLRLAPPRIRFEGEAAMALQVAAEAAPGDQPPYPFAVESESDLIVIDPAPMWRAALADRAAGLAATVMARRFHTGVADVFAGLALSLAARHGAKAIALSGGVFQNALLLEIFLRRLAGSGLDILIPEQVPTNDGGLAFGQAAVAAARLTDD
ncbi:carbamoyltransferase HypF [Ancylobacter sonchi]|uniref:carbamoyltransferase HypF n=1 Tax=Ancylobacter sonchi TaxID=1937790 RepID=UPI001BD1D584|nr:carbamoyltransferase HypF [Ancylobacter sonchi]MBS7534793.1 carbamoyltransferase HypF [Ancylobacter sonchi]